MTEDDDAPDRHDGQAMLYDYFKHLTSLCLFSLGGVVLLADKAQGRSAALLVGALGVIALAAIVSFSASGMIVAARLTGKPLDRSFELFRTVAPFLLSIGVGMFVYLFTGSLKF